MTSLVKHAALMLTIWAKVFRVLQEDVYHDRNGWQNWLATKLASWAKKRSRGEPAGIAIVPNDQLYLGGVYARLREDFKLPPSPLAPS